MTLEEFANRLAEEEMRRITQHPEVQAIVLRLLMNGEEPPEVTEEMIRRWHRETLDS